MKPGIKQRWITALTSGKYTQGRGALKTGATDDAVFCCLGVLCDIMKSESLGRQWIGRRFHTKTGSSSISLPKSIRVAAGVTEKQVKRLITMNDAKHCTFDTIAAYIKRYL